MGLGAGKISYVIKDSILRDYVIGFEKSDGTLFQVPLRELSLVQVMSSIPEIAMNVGYDYQRALQGRVYDPIAKIPQDLKTPASIDEATKILAQGKLDVESNLRSIYATGNPESLIRKIDGVKHLRGIQLQLAYHVYAKGDPQKFLAGIEQQDQGLLETLKDILPQDFPDFLRAKFQNKSRFISH